MGLPWLWMWTSRHNFSSIRLQRRLRQLDGWVEPAEEGLVLREWRERLPDYPRRVRLSRIEHIWRAGHGLGAGAFAPSSGACRACLGCHRLCSSAQGLKRSAQVDMARPLRWRTI